jgi:hypothetical protein
MIGRRVRWLMLAAAVCAPAALAAQEGSLESRLSARGLPADLAQEVQRIAADAAAQGVPAGPLADKAIEGWAKHVPPTRIVSAVRLFAGRMAEAGAAVRSAGIQNPSGSVIAAAAEAMGGGLRAEEVQSVVRAARTAEAAAPGLSVAASLAAQGIGTKQAVTIVVNAMEHRRPMSQLLDLPSVARSMHDQGMSPGEIGDKLMPHHGDEGGGGEHHGDKGGDRPPGVPPGPDHPGGPEHPSGPDHP